MTPTPDPLSSDAGNGALPMCFDPDAFPAAVAGVPTACNQMSAVAEANPKTPDHPQDAFGTVGQAWLEFHQAWAGEVVAAAQALGEMVGLLPAASTSYQHVDHIGGSNIAHWGGEFGVR